jgi:WW domain
MASNPAAVQGWVKSTDPKTGRVFYANHVTRKTQWDPPAGWVEPRAEAMMPPAPPALVDEDEEALPSNWEMMHDPTTGKAFYGSRTKDNPVDTTENRKEA